MNVNKFNNLWRVYREEATPDGEQGGAGEATPDADAAAVAEAAGEEAPESERPEWLLDKYLAEGKTTEDAIKDQAKSYKELQSKLGSFTGAPEKYEVVLAQEIKDAGFDIDSESDMLKDAIEFAKESNMSQDGFNKMIELWATNELAVANAQKQAIEESFKSLDNAQSRINNISAWANKSLPADLVGELDGMLTTPESVKLVERMIAMSRNAPVTPDESRASNVSAEDVTKMQFEKDEHGNRRINTDPEFRKRYIKLRDEVHGTEEHRQQYG